MRFHCIFHLSIMTQTSLWKNLWLDFILRKNIFLAKTLVYINIIQMSSVESQKGTLSIFWDVPLRTRRALLLYKLYGDGVLLVPNGTSLNSDSALLALNWRYVWITVLCLQTVKLCTSCGKRKTTKIGKLSKDD